VHCTLSHEVAEGENDEGEEAEHDDYQDHCQHEERMTFMLHVRDDLDIAIGALPLNGATEKV